MISYTPLIVNWLMRQPPQNWRLSPCPMTVACIKPATPFWKNVQCKTLIAATNGVIRLTHWLVNLVLWPNICIFSFSCTDCQVIAQFHKIFLYFCTQSECLLNCIVMYVLVLAKRFFLSFWKSTDLWSIVNFTDRACYCWVVAQFDCSWHWFYINKFNHWLYINKFKLGSFNDYFVGARGAPKIFCPPKGGLTEKVWEPLH